MIPSLGSITFDSAVESSPARGAQDKAVTVQNPAGPAIGMGVILARREPFQVTYVVSSAEDLSDAIHALQGTEIAYATERRSGMAIAQSIVCPAVRTELADGSPGWLHTVQASLIEVPA